MKILLLEDDAKLAGYVYRGLEEGGHSVDHLTNGCDALSHALYAEIDLAIVDRMVPGIDGVSVVRALRGARKQVPVLMLTALGDVADRVEGSPPEPTTIFANRSISRNCLPGSRRSPAVVIKPSSPMC